ncbi:hypothetical protein [Nitrosococcus oceani]|uniref:hypothetical protein n=1 Tax=Nitrosococcus oceani TaxID=1229 RepID=UPI0012E07A44|nr:hypothetical protein [Nitrosococcus oceani]
MSFLSDSISQLGTTPAAWLAGKCRNPRYSRVNNTRQGYARKSTLKPAGYLFLGV